LIEKRGLSLSRKKGTSLEIIVHIVSYK